MIKTEVLLLVIAISAIFSGAFPTGDEQPTPAENPVEDYSTPVIDLSLESKNVTKDKEIGDVIKVSKEETNNEKEKLHGNCNHDGLHVPSHSVFWPFSKLIIRPTPVIIVPLELYRGWYGGSGYGSGYMDGVGYGLDSIDHDPMRRDIAADKQVDITIVTDEKTPEGLTPPTKENISVDFAPPTKEGMAAGALTEEELSELARCGYGYGGGFGGGFNGPVIIPVPVNQGLQPSIFDVNLSRVNGLNTNNRPAIDWLTILRLLG